MTATLTVPLIERNSHAAVPKGFQLQLKNNIECGQVLNLKLHITTAQGAKLSDPIDLLLGYTQLSMDMLHDDSDWTVNPQNEDTVDAGAWKLGEPECSLVLGVVTQPERDHTPGEGKLSFHTGPQKGANFSSDDVDGGRTTVESPIYALGNTRYPRLVYYAWHVAVDLSSINGPRPVTADLVAFASNDGGSNWIEIDRVHQNTENWLRRDIALNKFLEPSQRMRFRFVIEDTSQVATVEAGIDDLEILDLVDRCEVPVHPNTDTRKSGAVDESPGISSGCSALHSSKAHSSLASLVLITLLGVVILRRRKHL